MVVLFDLFVCLFVFFRECGSKEGRVPKCLSWSLLFQHDVKMSVFNHFTLVLPFVCFKHAFL